MTDNSLLGYEAESHEVDAIYDALVGDRDGEDIPPRYHYLTSRQVLFGAVVKRLADERRRLVVELYDELGDDRSYAKVADILGLSRSRVQQFIEEARGADGEPE
ncbi:sigma factor-like helix-turn-helix DNA-binding protein [Nocardia paucivorans]|uniref:sigma factor-like helix-turn-helix DNA-binding protein n=1 Tax=Nocardia paucivorans TaxID=114259 RepID=UPI000316B5CA|nr:sigma factor-like helix-turn-helix DNA-binding protein [Nocardia paucivorans]